MTIKNKVSSLIESALAEAHNQGLLPLASSRDISVERPQRSGHGDLASSTPLKLARSFRLQPIHIAEILLPLIPVSEEIDRAWIVAPGFINFEFSKYWLRDQLEEIIRLGEAYGNLNIGDQRSVLVEFVSVNPTGPVHVGHARGGVLGSTLSNVLIAAGFKVKREYYINDAGNQMEVFYKSLYARYRESLGQDSQMPERGYIGEYLLDLSQEIIAEKGDSFLKMEKEQAIARIGKMGLQKMIESIKTDLSNINVSFDEWFSEQSLFENGQYEKIISMLDTSGYTANWDGAVWFTSTSLGEDKDNVLIRSSGTPTYFASDIAYHYNKLIEREFDKVIDIWGADHQGHVPRMKAAIGALGVDTERLLIIISQLVTLKHGAQRVKASKRSGDIVTLRELVDEVGADPCRFFFLSHSAESQMDFDLELARKESSENPVYYIQYAHARISSIMRLAEERQIKYSNADVSLLVEDAELHLIRKMVQFPELIEQIALKLEPHHLSHYSLELATSFHWFYKQCRVVSSIDEEESITKARLKLVAAAQIVIARCLSIMGMSAPAEM